MNSKLLHFSIISLGLLSACFAVENITGEVVEDLFFYDGVQLSDVTYPSNLEATTGTSSVKVNGTGSITVGSRNDGGMLRLIVWGGTTVSSKRTWDATDSKSWWGGLIAAPVQARILSADNIGFSSTSGHEESQVVPLVTYGLGMRNETFSFSPSATLVLPVSVPNFTKLWFVVKDGDTLGKIAEEDYCIVQSELCVVDVAAANEITLVRERFDACIKRTVTNGYMGTPPYCQIECNRGFVYNSDLSGCVTREDENAIEVFGADEGDMHGTREREEGTVSFLAGPARQGYVRYTGSNLQRISIDTTNLTGDDLQAVLIKNAAAEYRNTDQKEGGGFSLTSLAKAINDLRGQIWVWENPIVPEGEEGVARSVVADRGSSSGGAVSGHASAPLLPSTGPVGIFVGIATLGLGLMAFSRRK